MMLTDKVALVYGAGGAIGGAVARAFAQAGSRVFLAGRTEAKLAAVAEDIQAKGGTVGIIPLDAVDEQQVDQAVEQVVAQAGSLDISFNCIGYGDVQMPLLEIALADFLQPITTAMQTQFLTTRAAVRQMAKQKSGVILYFGGGGPQTNPGLGGFKIALDAVEGLRRQWAVELGAQGIRVITIKTGGIPESISDDFAEKAAITASITGETLLGRVATLSDVGAVATFLASDLARTITATEINISCGAMVE